MLNLAESVAQTFRKQRLVCVMDGVLYDDPETTAKRLLEEVKRRAIARWGERRWVLELTRTYCEIYQAKGDEKATIDNRRRQIQRTFEVWSCTLETAIALAAAVDCRFQMACTSIEVIDL